MSTTTTTASSLRLFLVALLATFASAVNVNSVEQQFQDNFNKFAGEVKDSINQDKHLLCSMMDGDTGSPEWVLGIVCGTLILFGLLFAFFGWRLYKIVVFLAGLAGGFFGGFALTSYLVLTVGGVDPNLAWPFWVALGVGIVLGLSLGSLMVCCIPVGFFVAGALLGVTVGVVANTLMATYISGYPEAGAFWAWVVGLGLIFGILGLFLGKYFVMLGTASYGSLQLAVGVSAALELAGSYKASICAKTLSPTVYWVYLSAVVVVAIAGFAFQYFNHREHENEGLKGRQQKRHPPVCEEV